MNFKLLPLIVFSSLLTISCASHESVHKKLQTKQVGPAATPHRSITNFSDGLRCMDNMMITYGVKDISVLLEDIADQTGKMHAGTKDMLITAVSTMTRRSRAVKLIPFGNASSAAINFSANAGSQSIYSVIPKYDIRGSISQLDSGVVREQVGGAIAADKWGLGASISTAGTILGIDLSVLSTEDLSIIPGVTSSNAVVIFRSGKGTDTDASIKKTGISFEFQVAENDATVQALRNLIELASIELVGKLIKLPYWQCLDIPDDNSEIQEEMSDWYYSMRTHGELGPYVRSLLLARGQYPMDISDENKAITIGIRNYQLAMGLKPDGLLDYKSFQLLLTGTKEHEQFAKLSLESPQNEKKNYESKTTAANITLRSVKEVDFFSHGEAIQLKVTSDAPVYLYCYLTNLNGSSQRFFPNRFREDNFLPAGGSIQLPGDMPFDIIADDANETIICYATPKNVYHALPHSIRAYDFEPLDIKGVEEIHKAFVQTNSGSVSKAHYRVTLR